MFDLIDSIVPTPGSFGTIAFPELNPPTPVFDRGFYFDGLLNKLDLTGLIINSKFTVNTWIKYVREAAVGINPIFSFDSPIPLEGPNPFNVFFETSTGLLNSLKLDLKI